MTDALPEVLLLDLDDTVVRFTAGQPDFWRLACERHLPSEIDVEQVLREIRRESDEFWGDEARAYWGRQNMFEARRVVARRALTPYSLGPVADAVADDMTRGKEDRVCPFPHAVEALTALRERGHRLGLLTNGSSEFQRRKLGRYDLEQHFELVLIEGELGFGKPDCRVFEKALAHFRVAPSDTLMIGDNLTADIGGAQAVGIPGVWCDYHGGGLPSDTRVIPARIIRAISDLVAPSAPTPAPL